MATLQLLLITLAVHTVMSDSHHLIVRPTDKDHSVCGEHSPCDTLSNLISNKTIFSDNSDLILSFKNGKHTVNTTDLKLITENKRSVTWNGTGARVICKSGSGVTFIFCNIEILQIQGISFINCGNVVKRSNEKPEIKAALYFEQVSTLHLEAIIVSGSIGYGLFALNLEGSVTIFHCVFKRNSKKCGINTKTCVGGNIALHFNGGKGKEPYGANILIQNSVIESSGNSNHVDTYNCTYFRKNQSSLLFRASGVVVVYQQEKYSVQLVISDTTFSHNSNDSVYPTVLVHDYSGLKNELTIANSSFEKGILVISNIANPACNVNKNCFAAKKGKHQATQLASIINCTFSGGIKGIEICFNSTYVRYNKFGEVLIKDTIFQNYEQREYLPTQAVITVSYLSIQVKKHEYPNTLIKIPQCTFTNNSIPSIVFNLDQDEYLIDSAPNRQTNPSMDPVFALTGTFFHENSASAILITVQNKLIPIWQYPIHEHGQKISILDITSCEFIGNRLDTHSKGVMEVKDAFITLENVTFSSSLGTALYAENSILMVKGWNLFRENSIDHGGAMNLNQSRIFLTSLSYIHIVNNSATKHGGGIFATAASANNVPSLPLCNYAEKVNSTYHYMCTISTLDEVNPNQELIKLERNSAKYSIFGGRYNSCIEYCNTTCCKFMPGEFNVRPIPSFISYSLDVSSPAAQICQCESNSTIIDCTNVSRNIFPGQTFTLSLVAIGEINKMVQTVVTAEIRKEGSEKWIKRFVDIGYGQKIQLLDTHCTDVSYRVNSDSKHEVIELSIDDKGILPEIAQVGTSVPLKPLLVKVTLSICPKGFELSNKTEEAPACKCLSSLSNNPDIECDTKLGEIQVKGNKWIGFAEDRLVLHESCPFDYCNCLSSLSSPCSKVIDLNASDEQCRYNRGGVLCGGCQAHLSMVLGTSNCKQCFDEYLLLIIPFALAGVALVVLLLKCNLTVSVGHINGIIFYANIVQINKTLLFPKQTTTSQIFSTFIAWLNLDLGIETCFYKGMDAYAKVWLQFVFPVYLWIIIGFILLAARFSSRLCRLIGSNSVPVLATLFLFSYAKLLRTIIAALAFTFIVFDDKTYETVWLKDANLYYFSLKHVTLFFVALLFTSLYVLPLTLLVLLAPCLQAKSHYKVFRWVNRLKPFLDAYQGPYQDRFRYWTGLLLVIRVLLLIIDASNYDNDPSMSFFCTIALTVPLVAVLNKTPTYIYRHKMANYIELISLINILTLFAVCWLTTTTNYLKWHQVREYTTYFSVAVTILLFLTIIMYQVILASYPSAFNKRDKPVEQTNCDVSNTEFWSRNILRSGTERM